MVRVSAERKPERCVPPSTVLMVLANAKTFSRVAVVVLQRDFDFDVVALAFHVDGRIVQRVLAAVQMLDEFGDAAGETELGGFFAALVGQRDFQALVQKGVVRAGACARMS